LVHQWSDYIWNQTKLACKRKPDLVIFVSDSDLSGVDEYDKSSAWQSEYKSNYTVMLQKFVTLIKSDGIELVIGGPVSKKFISFSLRFPLKYACI
jgi:hypothetical protein